MCKGQQSTTTSQTPNPTALAAYNNLIGSASSLAQTPFTPYTNQMVAPLTSEQNAGITGINSYANAAQPGISAAEGLVNQSVPYLNESGGLLGQSAGLYQGAANPLTTSQINQYMNPYTQDVVSATEQQFNLQNAQQQNNLVGNAASVGALGGNRIGVAQAQLAGQQQTAEAPVIAGLYNQAYQTGLGTAETEFQQNPEAAAAGMTNTASGLTNTASGLNNAAYGLGSLATAGQSAGLQGAGAQIQAGTLQQQTQQAIDTNAYNYYLSELGYPYQQLNFESGIDTGVGSLMGGTGVTQGPTPSMLGQVAGLGIAGAGLYNSGAFSALGSALPALAALKTGGRAGTVPEGRDTLEAQQHQLKHGDRPVQMFPEGTHELSVPHGMRRATEDGSSFHYNPRQISPHAIRHLTRSGRENEFLGLGPVSKGEALHRASRGEHPVSIVERRPNGTEVRASAATMETLHHQHAAMERGKDPGNTIHVEHPHETLARRSSGGVAPHLDAGGAAPGIGLTPYGESGPPYGGGQSYIPSLQITHGRGPPAPPNPTQPQNVGQQISQFGNMYKTAMGSGSGSNAYSGSDWAAGADEPESGFLPDIGSKSGGRIPHFDTGGGADDDTGVLPPSSGFGTGSFQSADSFLPPAAGPPIQTASLDTPASDASGVAPEHSTSPSMDAKRGVTVAMNGNSVPNGVLQDAAYLVKQGASSQDLQGFMSRNGYPMDGNWCGEFAASVVNAAGGQPPPGAAVATNWMKYGRGVSPQDVQPGDVAVLTRGHGVGETGGHVGFVSGVDPQHGTFSLMGGNQGSAVKSEPMTGFQFRRGDYSDTSAGVAATNSVDPSGQGEAEARGLPRTAQAATPGVANDAGMSPGNQALIAAGLGMMASGSPYPLQQIGQGGLQGLQAYSQAKTRELAVQRLGVEADKARRQLDIEQQRANEEQKYHSGELGLRQGQLDIQQQQLKQQGTYQTGELGLRQGQLDIQRQQAERQDALARLQAMQPVKIGVDQNTGEDVYGVRDPATGQLRPIDPSTGQLKGAALPSQPQPGAPTVPGAPGISASPTPVNAPSNVPSNVPSAPPGQSWESPTPGQGGIQTPETAAIIPKAPPGANPKAWREEMSKKTADEVEKMRESALGSIDFLRKSREGHEMLQQASPQVFGPVAGTEEAQKARGYASYIPVLGKIPQSQADDYTKLKGLFTDLGTARFRQNFGARPTQMEFSKTLEMVGGPTAASKESAEANLTRYEEDSYANLQRAVDAGIVRPKDVDLRIVADGVERGLMHPQSFGIPTVTSKDQVRQLPPGAVYARPNPKKPGGFIVEQSHGG
jgi:uncharacterized protein (TIGR02594 family)